MIGLRADIIAFLWSNGPTSIEGVGKNFSGIRTDTLDSMVRSRYLRVTHGEGNTQLYSVTLRGRIAAGMIEAPQKTPPRRPKFTGEYDPVELQPSVRPGANDAFTYPSRIGNVRVWRGGKTEAIDAEKPPGRSRGVVC